MCVDGQFSKIRLHIIYIFQVDKFFNITVGMCVFCQHLFVIVCLRVCYQAGELETFF